MEIVANDKNWQEFVFERNSAIHGSNLGLFERHQNKPTIDGSYSSYHFTYEPGLRSIYKDPTAYEEVERLIERDGYLPEGYIENNYDPENFKLKEGYVAAVSASDTGKPQFIGGSASDDYAITFIGDEVADLYDGKVVKVLKPIEVWKKTDNVYEKQ